MSKTPPTVGDIAPETTALLAALRATPDDTWEPSVVGAWDTIVDAITEDHAWANIGPRDVQVLADSYLTAASLLNQRVAEIRRTEND
jgi:hypothetical protein